MAELGSQSSHPSSTHVTSAFGINTNSTYENIVISVSECDYCYFVAEVANFVRGTTIISSSDSSTKLSLGMTSFSFGEDRTIFSNPEPIIVFSFSDTYIFDQQIL